ncbi:MAG: hypothetical protein R3C18_03500 [Planctomycetaceae bacterium]
MRVIHRERMHRRRGHTLLIAVTVLSICSIIVVLLTRTTLQRYSFADRLLLKAQADCIAESAIVRAEHELLKDPAYIGETWTIESLPDNAGTASANIVVGDETIHVVATLSSDASAVDTIRVERQRSRTPQ